MMYKDYMAERNKKNSAWTSMCYVLSMKISEYKNMTDKNAKDLYLETDELLKELADNVQMKYDIMNMIEEGAPDDDLISLICTPTLFGIVTTYLDMNRDSKDSDAIMKVVSVFSSPTLVKFLYTLALSSKTYDKVAIIEVYLHYAQHFAYHELSVLGNILAFIDDSEDIFIDALSEVIDDPTQDLDKVIKRFY